MKFFRPEIVNLISLDARHVLDVGCANGDVGLSIKNHRICEVVGIELCEAKAKIASSKIDRVIAGNVETIDPDLKKKYFDHIVFADVLEHLKDPICVLCKYIGYLKDDGYIVVSIPNIRHFSVLFELIARGEWEYRTSGIMDEGHLRFFTNKSFKRLIRKVGLEIVSMNRIFSIKGSYALNVVTLGIFRDFLTAQYVFLLKKQKNL
jgi:2-polyprenyl-3-methyl-5-hydroxy-6-metoxy-1,4-benzoquinol methylase